MDVIAYLKGVFLLCQAFGILPYNLEKSNGSSRFTKSKKRLLYTKFLFVLYLCIQVYLFWFSTAINWKFISENSLKTVLIMSTVSAALSNLLIFRSLIKFNQVFGFWLNEINRIFSRVTAKTMKKIGAFSAASMTATGVFLLFMALSEIYIRYIHCKPEHKAIFHIVVFMVFSFHATVWEIKLFIHLFGVIVNLMRCYYKEVNNTLREGTDNADKKFWFSYLRALRLRDLEMKDLVEFLHEFFVPVITCRLLWGFTNLLFNVTAASRTGVPNTVGLLWTFYIGFDIFMVVLLCHLLETEGEKTHHYLHELFINWDDKELRSEIELLSLQVQHKKIEFSALGFHKLNFSLLYRMVGMLTSTTVILLQFESEPIISKEYCNKLILNASQSLSNGFFPYHSKASPNNS